MRKHAAKSAATLLMAASLGACPGRPQAPRVPPAVDATVPLAGAVRGVAGEGPVWFAALAGEGGTTIVARRAAADAWRTELPGRPAALAATGALVAAAVSANGTLGDTPLRGDPGAALIALDGATGATKWTVVVDSTEWAVVSDVAPYGDGFIVGGLFGGTLRIGKRVVTSAGGSDGFVARIAANGELVWLVRSGGALADGIQGVATRGERIAIAGTFTTGAELGGVPLAPYDDRSPFGDGFAAELDASGARKWAATFGGRADDTVAGVTIDARGNVVVAGSAREVVHVGSAQLVTQGEGDGVLVWFDAHGEPSASVLVGGLDFDGLRDITSAGDKVIAGGFFSGSITLGDRTLTAGGGDDSFIAAFDHNGTVATVWHVGGDGREEITALGAVPGGFIAGVAHTAAASIEGAQLAAPTDPMQGGALVVRGVP